MLPEVEICGALLEQITSSTKKKISTAKMRRKGSHCTLIWFIIIFWAGNNFFTLCPLSTVCQLFFVVGFFFTLPWASIPLDCLGPCLGVLDTWIFCVTSLRWTFTHSSQSDKADSGVFKKERLIPRQQVTVPLPTPSVDRGSREWASEQSPCTDVAVESATERRRGGWWNNKGRRSAV